MYVCQESLKNYLFGLEKLIGIAVIQCDLAFIYIQWLVGIVLELYESINIHAMKA